MLKVGDFCWHKRDGVNRCGQVMHRGDTYITVSSPIGRDVRFHCYGSGDGMADFIDIPLDQIWWCCSAIGSKTNDWAERGIWGYPEPPIPPAFMP